MEWLLVALMINGSSIPLNTYKSETACRAVANPMNEQIYHTKMWEMDVSADYLIQRLKKRRNPLAEVKTSEEITAEANAKWPRAQVNIPGGESREQVVCIPKG